mmetsp:Transcript_13997/g.19426  ORF Transcript_13997/g.19426 Transcript_13997/m.19426 type:complete len:118 (-) Transcript_13997:139-492(-)
MRIGDKIASICYYPIEALTAWFKFVPEVPRSVVRLNATTNADGSTLLAAVEAFHEKRLNMCDISNLTRAKPDRSVRVGLIIGSLNRSVSKPSEMLLCSKPRFALHQAIKQWNERFQK